MKKKLFSFVTIVLVAAGINLSNATVPQYAQSAFIAKQDNKIIKAIGKYENRHAPFSTFKIVLALMGFDAGILKDKDTPKWVFKEEYEKNFPNWFTREIGLRYNHFRDHIPATYMKDSVLWFSHQITARLGTKKFQDYIKKLNYGNGDVSGTPGKNDGLLNSWLGTSLEISPLEQVKFLEKLLANKLDLSKGAQEKIKEIMNREEDWDGWKLYGKTGGGREDNGWFIGWVEKDGQQIVFAQYLDLRDPNLDLTGITVHKSIGLTAKEVAKREIMGFLRSVPTALKAQA